MTEAKRATIIRQANGVVRHAKALLREISDNDATSFELAVQTLIRSLNNQLIDCKHAPERTSVKTSVLNKASL